ncbi:hypothetical protein E2C01_008647 [Portunus trituberculatus]|uniref:Uncharacterized protein n=1 Tax=Portunus trituberculatus TaxID=210409 RepID=A0A5B7D5K1_PORTR|nr:hypothetical protein [Portunus trituberculatus]
MYSKPLHLANLPHAPPVHHSQLILRCHKNNIVLRFHPSRHPSHPTSPPQPVDPSLSSKQTAMRLCSSAKKRACSWALPKACRTSSSKVNTLKALHTTRTTLELVRTVKSLMNTPASPVSTSDM